MIVPTLSSIFWLRSFTICGGLSRRAAELLSGRRKVINTTNNHRLSELAMGDFIVTELFSTLL